MGLDIMRKKVYIYLRIYKNFKLVLYFLNIMFTQRELQIGCWFLSVVQSRISSRGRLIFDCGKIDETWATNST